MPVNSTRLEGGYWLIALVMVLFAGGVHPKVILVAGGISVFTMLALASSNDRTFGRSTLVVGLCALLSMGAFLQLIPLPGAIQRWLNPFGWSIYSKGAELLGGQTSARPISMAPASTALAAIRWSTIAVAGLLASKFSARSSGWVRVLWATMGLGIFHAALMASQFGLGWMEAAMSWWLPGGFGRDVLVSTFINPNHAAILSAMASLSATTLALLNIDREETRATVIALCGLVVCLGATLAAGSASVSIIAVSGCVLFALVHWGRMESRSVIVRRLVVGLIWGAVAGVAAFSAGWLSSCYTSGSIAETEVLAGLFGETSLRTRLELSGAALRAAEQFPLGFGAGATESVLSAHLDWTIVGASRVPTIENQVYQWIAEYGFVGGAVLLAGMGVYGIRVARAYIRRGELRDLSAACFFVMLGLLTQLHFPWASLGLALPAVACLVALPSRADLSPKPNGKSGTRGVWHERLLEPDGGGEWSKWSVYAVSGALLIAVSIGTIVHVWAVESGSQLPIVDRRQVNSSPKNLRRAQWWRPCDGTIYLAAGFQRLPEAKETAALAEFAVRIHPTPGVRYSAGHLFAAAESTERSVQTFRRLFTEVPRIPRSWAGPVLVGRFQSGEIVGRVLAGASERYWRAASSALGERLGGGSVVDFALVLNRENPSAGYPMSLLSATYLELGQPLLARWWAQRLLEAAQDEGGVRSSDNLRLGYVTLLDVLREEEKLAEARSLAIEATERLPLDRKLAKRVIWLLPSPDDPDSDVERWISLASNATELICRERVSGEQWTAKQCLIGRGWIAEQNGEFEQAFETYRRLAIQYRHLSPFIRLVGKTGACDRARELLDETPRGSPWSSKESRSISRVAESCSK